nr:MAG TPA: hypothetical protein [Caudoviricetes sp.]
MCKCTKNCLGDADMLSSQLHQYLNLSMSPSLCMPRGRYSFC